MKILETGQLRRCGIIKGVLKEIVVQCIPYKAIREGNGKPLRRTHEISRKIREKRAFSNLQNSLGGS